MKGFIVWDSDEKCFYDGKNNGINVFKLNQDGTLSYYDGCYDDDYANKFYTLFENIGLKDINDKSIYADCSIVEFNYCFGWQLVPTKHIGYFSKDNESLQLEIIFIDDKKYNKQEYTYIYMSNFKIIDTIQENKLGLIK